MTDNFAIPGLMTPRVAEKAALELRSDGRSPIDIPFWRSPSKRRAVRVRVLKPKPCEWETLIDDVYGCRVFRLPSGSETEYSWRIDPSLYPLPNGDFEVYIDIENEKRKKRILKVLNDNIAPFTGVPKLPNLAIDGSIPIPINQSILVVPFGVTYKDIPFQINLSVQAPSGGGVVPLTYNLVGPPTTTGFEVVFNPPAPVSGYTLFWQAIMPLVNATNQQGSITLNTGAQIVPITFPQTMAGVPAVWGTLATPSGGTIYPVSFNTGPTSESGFTLYLSQPLPLDGYVFTYTATVL